MYINASLTEELRLLFEHLQFEQTERRVVIQNGDAATKRLATRSFSSLNGEIPHLNSRQPTLSCIHFARRQLKNRPNSVPAKSRLGLT
jgi:hypothetical protein